MAYYITLPRGIKIDIFNIPADFEKIIENSFEEFTKGTAKQYMYQDKLYWIDRFRNYLYGNQESYDAVNELIKKTFGERLDEYGEFMSESEFLSTEFMEDCYSLGEKNPYHHHEEDRYINDRLLEVVYKAIKVVLNYGDEGLEPLGGMDTDGNRYLICNYCSAVVSNGEYFFNYCPDCGKKIDYRRFKKDE